MCVSRGNNLKNERNTLVSISKRKVRHQFERIPLVLRLFFSECYISNAMFHSLASIANKKNLFSLFPAPEGRFIKRYFLHLRESMKRIWSYLELDLSQSQYVHWTNGSKSAKKIRSNNKLPKWWFLRVSIKWLHRTKDYLRGEEANTQQNSTENLVT